MATTKSLLRGAEAVTIAGAKKKNYRIYSQGRDTGIVVQARDPRRAVRLARQTFPTYMLGWPGALTAREER